LTFIAIVFKFEFFAEIDESAQGLCRRTHGLNYCKATKTELVVTLNFNIYGLLLEIVV